MTTGNEPPKRTYNTVKRPKKEESPHADPYSRLSVLTKIRGTIFPLICPECNKEMPGSDATWLHFVLKHMYEEGKVYPKSYFEPYREKYEEQKRHIVKTIRRMKERERKNERDNKNQ